MKDRGFAEIELLGAWKGKTHKKFALGVVSHRSLNAESPAEVAEDIRRALKYVDVENLFVTSDCGFGRQGANRLVAFYKSAAAAQGTNVVRREYGLAETYIPCADPRLTQDVIPRVFEDGPGTSRSSAFTPTPAIPAPLNDRASHRSTQAPRFSDILKQRR
jgi:5-methyltetrahydropteroyltriglutamate--homocysteine methyltransferase